MSIDAAEAAARSLYPNMTRSFYQNSTDEPAKPAGETLLAGGEQKPAEQQQQQPAKNGQPAAPEVKPGDLPEAVKALREQPARKMFDATKTYTDALRRSEFADTDPDLDKVVNAEVSEIFQDIGVSNTEASTLITLARTPASDETRASWESESSAYLATLGKDARESLHLARTLVARDPRVAAMLDETGLGSHPAVVEMLISKAKSARLRGEI